jgi:hypothetical protein
LDAIEGDLIRLCGAFGKGWAIYVRRLETRGLREYYVYFGVNAELQKVVPSLRSIYAGYRIEFELRSDPHWSHYKSWLKEPEASG